MLFICDVARQIWVLSDFPSPRTVFPAVPSFQTFITFLKQVSFLLDHQILLGCFFRYFGISGREEILFFLKENRFAPLKLLERSKMKLIFVFLA